MILVAVPGSAKKVPFLVRCCTTASIVLNPCVFTIGEWNRTMKFLAASKVFWMVSVLLLAFCQLFFSAPIAVATNAVDDAMIHAAL